MPEAPAAPPVQSAPAPNVAVPASPLSTSHPPPAGSPLHDSFSDLEGFTSDPDSGKSNPKSADKPVEQKLKTPEEIEDEKALEAPIEKPAENPAEKPADKPTEKPGDQKPPSRAAELRTAYERTKLERDELKAKYEAASSRLKELEGVNPEEFQKRIEAAEKRAKDYEDKLKFTNYEQSEEFQEKYRKPFIDAFSTGRARVRALKIIAEDGTERQGTDADFDRIVQITDDGQAADLAAEIFGSKAPLVLMHREKVYERNEAMNRASEEFKKTGSERQKQSTEQLQKEAAHRMDLWTKFNKQAAEKYPELFKPIEGDEEGNKLLEEGYKLADLAFSGDNSLPPEKMVAVHSSVRNRAAAFGRVLRQSRKLQGQLKDALSELEKFKASVPGAGEGAKTGAAKQSDDWESDLEKRAVSA